MLSRPLFVFCMVSGAPKPPPPHHGCPLQAPSSSRRRTPLARPLATSPGGSMQTLRRWQRWALRSFPTGEFALPPSSSRSGRGLENDECTFCFQESRRFSHLQDAVADVDLREEEEKAGGIPPYLPATGNSAPGAACFAWALDAICPIGVVAAVGGYPSLENYACWHRFRRINCCNDLHRHLRQVSGRTTDQNRGRPSRRKIYPGRRGRRGVVHGVLLQHRLRVSGRRNKVLGEVVPKVFFSLCCQKIAITTVCERVHTSHIPLCRQTWRSRGIPRFPHYMTLRI